MADIDEAGQADQPERRGPGFPPKQHQFQPGRSGNPKGRPRGALGLRAILEKHLNERVAVTVDGKRRKVSKLEIVIMAAVAKAAKGDERAAHRLVSLWVQAFGIEDQRKEAHRLSDSDELALQLFLNGGDRDGHAEDHDETHEAREGA